jgi:Holliday junction DNA helicase RuvA
MIARLRGTLVERSADAVVVECGGVGYDVTVSLATLAGLAEVGAEVTLRVFTHASENRVALYGFATAEERQLFDLLITVKNVGPATAIGILSGASSPQALARTIAAGDGAALTRIRGVGKKTSDLLIVELKEKCEWLIATWGAAGASIGDGPPLARRSGQRAPVLDDVASALVNLGWRPAEADKAVAALAVANGATVETLLREALRAMSR